MKYHCHNLAFTRNICWLQYFFIIFLAVGFFVFFFFFICFFLFRLNLFLFYYLYASNRLQRENTAANPAVITCNCHQKRPLLHMTLQRKGHLNSLKNIFPNLFSSSLGFLASLHAFTVGGTVTRGKKDASEGNVNAI